jgi:steroid 5-alpha reductase family enzyme
VDVTWSAGVGVLAIAFATAAHGDIGRRMLVAALVSVWSFRLAGYLLTNRVLSGEEDGRYQMLRGKWGPRADLHFLWFFQVQALGAVLFAVPLLPGLFLDVPVGRWYDFAGVGVWLISIGGETLSDRQLSRFRRRPDSKGKTCREGLWRYSRHPNYFFEWIHWWTYVLLAWGSAWVWVSLLGPIVMLVLLFRVTGIPYTEKRALRSRGEDYRRYQRTTSAFIPLPPGQDEEDGS